MFVLATIVDTVRLAPVMFSQPTLLAVHSEMDKKYPNRVIMNVGLVIGRYGDALQVGDGVCAAGDGGAHHEVVVRLVVYRPFIEEVCIGTILASSEEGIQVTMGFFDDIFIPAYWMLRPSLYDRELSLWVWTPNYDEEEGEENNDDYQETDPNIKSEEDVRKEGCVVIDENKEKEDSRDEEKEVEDRFEMYIGAEIRFKVKSINFTQVTKTAKGVQATTTTTSHSEKGNASNSDGLRKRSSSVDLSYQQKVPSSMGIVASICEDGLGLTSWWAAADQEEEPEEDMA
mmetsp:Transcript_23222/g.26469  ORF Transcript_23222/g.26469 Transcript_23222/m.26469 type:complete len:286 (-) Transcript_23222:289-1146(-)